MTPPQVKIAGRKAGPLPTQLGKAQPQGAALSKKMQARQKTQHIVQFLGCCRL